MKVEIKPSVEFASHLKGIRKAAVVVCKRCFREFEADNAPEMAPLLEKLKKEGVEAVSIVEADFLCNDLQAKEALSGIGAREIDAVITLCGVGAQVIAQTSQAPVVMAGDAQPERGFEGVSLGRKRCMACGKCLLNMTAGICPIADCAKSLTNGPCGGAKDGKCEANPQKDCAWLLIYRRLKSQGRLDALKGEVYDRDFSRPSFAERLKIEIKVAQKRDEGFSGGVYPLENKELLSGRLIEALPEPAVAVAPMAQHIGAPCQPVVAVGDIVAAGQEIGSSTGYVSAPVHAPISGKVVAIERRPHPTIKGGALAVVIENDGAGRFYEGWGRGQDADSITREEIIDIVRRSGIVGLGGAMFPTYVKLKPPKPVDLFILNGCECEPYLSADDRLMVENAVEVAEGVKLLMKALGVAKAVIAIEDNKPAAFERMKKAAGDFAEVALLSTKYPQGAERMLVMRLTGREVPRGGLPFDVGVVVNNVATAYAVYEAVCLGKPLISRVITVCGAGILKPGNYRIRIGTPIRDVLTAVGVAEPDALISEKQVMMGGPMMGVVQADASAPIVKGTSGLTVVEKSDIAYDEGRRCIRCGRCVEVCPMALLPHRLWRHATDGDMEMLERLGCVDCIECGCCEYICAAKLPLVAVFKRGKAALRRKKDAGDKT